MNKSGIENFKIFLQNNSILFVALSLLIIFSFTSRNFFTFSNLLNILQQVSIAGIVAIGSTIVILTGDIDLSPDAVVLLSGVITGGLVYNGTTNIFVGILLGLLAGALVGLFNGFLIEIVGVSSVIVTLGVMIGFRGLAQIILGYFDSWITMDKPFFKFIAFYRIGFIPIIVIILFITFIAAYFFLNYTAFGRNIYAIGNNKKAAELCGINIKLTKIGIYVLAGTLYGFAGILLSIRTGTIMPSVGEGIVFQGITAAILGGTALKGGIGRIQNVLIGVIVVGFVANFMTLAGVSAYYQRAVTGLLILAAVLLDRFVRGSE